MRGDGGEPARWVLRRLGPDQVWPAGSGERALDGRRTDEHAEATAPSLEERTLERDDVGPARVELVQLAKVERERGHAFFQQAHELVFELGCGVVVQVAFEHQRVAPGALLREREMRALMRWRGGGRVS